MSEDQNCCGAADELNKVREALIQTTADFSNYKKRSAQVAQANLDRELGSLVAEMLPALDALDGAIEAGIEGAQAVSDMVLGVLGGVGLEVLHLEGKPFNPENAEAFIVGEGSSVRKTLRRGYLWRGTLLRAALVEIGEEGPCDDS